MPWPVFQNAGAITVSTEWFSSMKLGSQSLGVFLTFSTSSGRFYSQKHMYFSLQAKSNIWQETLAQTVKLLKIAGIDLSGIALDSRASENVHQSGMEKWGEALKKKIPSDHQKICLCSQCHERLNKLMALDASIFLTGKEGNSFYSHSEAEVSPQTWPLALQVSMSKVPVTWMCSLLVRGGGCITSVASLNPSIPNCWNA